MCGLQGHSQDYCTLQAYYYAKAREGRDNVLGNIWLRVLQVVVVIVEVGPVAVGAAVFPCVWSLDY